MTDSPARPQDDAVARTPPAESPSAKRPQSGGTRSQSTPDPVHGTDPFDLWLRRSLHQSFDGALEERLPADLLRLVSDNRAEWEATKSRWLGDAPPEAEEGADGPEVLRP